jgi:transcription elongation factor Elf1
MSKKVIHYNTGKSFFGPTSGEHIVTTCGLSFQVNHKSNFKRITSNINKVTCKTCNKYLQMENN